MITHEEDYITGFNPEAVTLQDCIDNYEKKNRVAIISNGKCVGFVKEIGTGAGFELNRRSIEVIQRINAGRTSGVCAVTG